MQFDGSHDADRIRDDSLPAIVLKALLEKHVAAKGV